MSEHCKRLERMYLSAPCNAYYQDLSASFSTTNTEIAFSVRPDMHHAAGALHGAHYFKPLDDAAFFAANSLVPEVFVLTVELTVQFFRPIVAGRVIARGRVTKPGKSILFGESVLYDAQNVELARASGCFAPSRIALNGIASYSAEIR